MQLLLDSPISLPQPPLKSTIKCSPWGAATMCTCTLMPTHITPQPHLYWRDLKVLPIRFFFFFLREKGRTYTQTTSFHPNHILIPKPHPSTQTTS